MIMPPPGRMPSVLAMSRPGFPLRCVRLLAIRRRVRRPPGSTPRAGPGLAIGFAVIFATAAPLGPLGMKWVGSVTVHWRDSGRPSGTESGLAWRRSSALQQRVEGAGGVGGGGDVAGAVAVGLAEVHADAPAGGGGVIGGQGLDTEHDLDFVAGVERGECAHGAVHAPVAPAGRLCRVERQGAHQGADGLLHEGGIDRSVFIEDGAGVVSWGWVGRGGIGHRAQIGFLICSNRRQIGRLRCGCKGRGGIFSQAV